MQVLKPHPPKTLPNLSSLKISPDISRKLLNSLQPYDTKLAVLFYVNPKDR